MQIPVDTYGDVVMKKVLVRSGFMLKIINIDRMCQRVHDPIFADTGRACGNAMVFLLPYFRIFMRQIYYSLYILHTG